MSTLKTIRQHWESLSNKKLGEWLMKQPLIGLYKIDHVTENEWDALAHISWVGTKSFTTLHLCHSSKSWQPLLDALPELRDGEVSEEFSLLKHTLKNGEFDYKPTSVQPHPTGSTRRSEILQLVAAMTMNKSLVWTPKDITDAVKQAILLQSEIDQQLNQR